MSQANCTDAKAVTVTAAGSDQQQEKSRATIVVIQGQQEMTVHTYT